jgi:ATP/maltotriose-dependent transcriptional regulator MalT
MSTGALETRSRRLPRPRLVARLAAAMDQPVLLLDAPPGYGKTSLLSEWLQGDHPRRRVSWLALAPVDAEPRRLLARLIAAVRQRFPAFECHVEPAHVPPGTGPAVDATVPRFLDALGGLPEPLVVVLDDAHVLRGPRVHELMDLVVAGLPPAVQLAIASRADPPLSLARRRAGGGILELRADDLRFDEDEVAGLLTGDLDLGLDAGTAHAVGAELVERTEGWPAGVALALRALRSEPDPVAFAARFTGAHRDVRDYLVEEVLRRLSPGVRTFLVRTSILRRMTGRLCDALLDASGSQATLEQLERSNLFVVPLDAERRWYRYHRAFGEVLRAELARSRPEIVAELHRRASVWFDAAGAHGEAAEHALSALRLATARRRRDRPLADPGGRLTDLDGGLVDPGGSVDDPNDGATVEGDGNARGEDELDDRFPTAALAPGVPVLEFGQRLTEREMTVLRLLPTRLSQREIAEELLVSVNTVKTHSRAIYRKLGVSSRQAATERARELALLGHGRGRGVGAAGGALAS